MAILFTQADGSDQHYDTYEEFEQAFILIKRLNGEKVPQDLLDEVKAKYGAKEPKPFQVQIDGNNFESAFREAVRDVGEELDRLSMDRTPISDECGNPEKGPKFEVGEPLGKDANGADLYEGDYVTGSENCKYGVTNSNAICEVVSDNDVKLVHTTDFGRKQYEGEAFGYIDLEEFVKLSDNMDEAKAMFAGLNGGEDTPRKVVALRDGMDVTGGREYAVVGEDTRSDGLVYIIDDAGDKQSMILGNEVEYESDTEDTPTEFRTGDIVRATEDVVGFGGQYVACNDGELLEVQIGGSGALCLVKDSWRNAYVSENLANIELVCRKEDRKDIEV